MGKIFHIIFLWIAGLLILAHQFIPHHHHNSENESCSIEWNMESHSHAIEFEESHHCECEHSSSIADCELDLKTIEKQSSQFSLYLVANILHIGATIKQTKQDHYAANDKILHHQHLFEYSLRGPPQQS